MLTSKQRAYLRGLATEIPVIMQVGKGGLTDNLVKTCRDAVEARELIKIKALENSGYSARECADILARDLGAESVGVSGRTFVLYRESEKKKRIELP